MGRSWEQWGCRHNPLFAPKLSLAWALGPKIVGVRFLSSPECTMFSNSPQDTCEPVHIHARSNAEQSHAEQSLVLQRPVTSNCNFVQQLRHVILIPWWPRRRLEHPFRAHRRLQASPRSIFEHNRRLRASPSSEFEGSGRLRASSSSVFERNSRLRASSSSVFERTGGSERPEQ